VAAYSGGIGGTVKHAVMLGAIVTFTHTVSVFALGMVTLFLYRYVMPEKSCRCWAPFPVVDRGDRAWMLYKPPGSAKATPKITPTSSP